MTRDADKYSGKTVALVLGSGGARGLAHIGVIEHLRSLDMEIRYISGCSMGALIGGIYAAGELQAYSEELEHTLPCSNAPVYYIW